MGLSGDGTPWVPASHRVRGHCRVLCYIVTFGRLGGFLKNYWFKRATRRERKAWRVGGREKRRSFIQCFTFQMPVISRVGLGWCQEPETPAESCRRVGGTQVPRPPSTAFSGTLASCTHHQPALLQGTAPCRRAPCKLASCRPALCKRALNFALWLGSWNWHTPQSDSISPAYEEGLGR